MIYDADYVPDGSGRSVVRAPHSFGELIGRFAVGLFFMGVGGLVLCTFLSGGAPSVVAHGAGFIVGWLILAVLFLALGVVPFWWGFSALFVTGSFNICPAERLIEARFSFCGLPIWIRRYSFRLFDRVMIRHYRSGFPVSRDRFLVAVEGLSRRIRFSTFTDTAASERLAATIAHELGVHVETAELYDNSRNA